MKIEIGMCPNYIFDIHVHVRGYFEIAEFEILRVDCRFLIYQIPAYLELSGLNFLGLHRQLS